MTRCFLIFLLLWSVLIGVASQEVSLYSPNKKHLVDLIHKTGEENGYWYFRVTYHHGDTRVEVIPEIELGILSSEESFTDNLSYLRHSKIREIKEQYPAIHGKRSICQNEANEVVITFKNTSGMVFNVCLRAYNDGIAFCYELPQKSGNYEVKDELTAYRIPDTHFRWLQKFDLSNENLYSRQSNDSLQQNWCYPALFNNTEDSVWYLIHESDVDRSYCATKLSNLAESSSYKVSLPLAHEGEGEPLPKIELPWRSPWRVIIIGDLEDIVESTLVRDVAKPSVIVNTDWIMPGAASWNYWSDNHGTKDYQTVCEFADLAAHMNWPYTLLDWEWDEMGNGGNVEDAADYILSRGVKPLIWYNSGMFKWITATPVDRMKTHESRVQEFTWLKEHGFAGVKIDFFLSEKQYMIDYYLDILEDAAEFELMVYFHGCLVPRGWQRTYPNLMTYEGVRGAEWYNNGPELTPSAPEHNTILPFTRNVVGSMDYTPVTFTNSQYPHLTSYGHELALSVLFESGIQHFADRPEGYHMLPDQARSFLKSVPVAWDDTKLLSGYPGKDIILSRKKSDVWYIAGINAEDKEKQVKVDFSFLPENQNYKLTLIEDGEHDKSFSTRFMVVSHTDIIEVNMLARGGFTGYLAPLR